MTDTLEDIWERLKTQRDEIHVQMHLARAELRDEIEALEPAWKKARQSFEEVREETEETAREMRDASRIVAEELSSAYHRIRNRLEEDS